MKTPVDQKTENKSQSVSNEESQEYKGATSGFPLSDHRPEVLQWKKVRQWASAGPQATKAKQLKALTAGVQAVVTTAKEVPANVQDTYVTEKQAPVQADRVFQMKMEGPITLTVKKNSPVGAVPAAPGGGPRNYTKEVTDERNTVREILYNEDSRLTKDPHEVIRAHIVPHRWGGPGDASNIVPWASGVHEDEWEAGQGKALEKLKHLEATDDITFEGTANYSTHLAVNWTNILKERLKKLSSEGKAKLRQFYNDVLIKRRLIPSSAVLKANNVVIATHQDTSANFKIDTSDERVHDILADYGYYELKSKIEEEEDSDEGKESKVEQELSDEHDVALEPREITGIQMDRIIRTYINANLKYPFYREKIKQHDISDNIEGYKKQFIKERIEAYKKIYIASGEGAVKEKVDASFKNFFEARISKLSVNEEEDDDDESVSSSSEQPQPNNSGRGWCFITTACVETLGLPDDCYELTTLRNFRDRYMAALPGGTSMIAEYYHIAPAIVSCINEQRNHKQIYEHLFEVIKACVKSIEAGHPAQALEIYKGMVILLTRQYLNGEINRLERMPVIV